jgi:DNA-binding NarL/FixJ family response regulator
MVVRVLVVDRQPMLRRRLEEALPGAGDDGVRVVAGTDRAASAALLARRHQPDVALVDLGIAEPGPLTALADMRQVLPHLPVLALSRHVPTVQDVLGFLGAGAAGVLLRNRPSTGLAPSLLAAADATDRPHTAGAGPQLTGKERHLWMLIAGGASTAQIARAMHVSERTVKRLTAGLLRTLGVANRTEAATLAGRAGLLDELDATGPPVAAPRASLYTPSPAPRDGGYRG